MKKPKVWLVLGATDGLGPAAVKYLLANKQLVIPVDLSTKTHRPENLTTVAGMYGPLDFIVNNSNYRLFNEERPDIYGSVSTTISLLSGLLSHLRQEPTSSIINIPPQLCLTSTKNQIMGEKLLYAMDTFLNALRQELETLDCGLHFLEPGERLV